MSRIHLFSLLCSSEGSDNLAALAAQRISVLQKVVKNLSQNCISRFSYYPVGRFQ